MLESQKEAIQAQARGIADYQVLLKGQDPAGCALYTISDDVYVLLLVKGVVNIDAELAKLEDKKAKTSKSIQQLEEKINAPDYMTKVKQDVRDRNEASLKSLATEMDAITTSIANFLKLK